MAAKDTIIYMFAQDATDSKAFDEVIGFPKNSHIQIRMEPDYRVPESLHDRLCLAIPFDQRHNRAGIVAGYDERADIHLPQLPGVSGHHFAFTFNEHCKPILQDSSKYGVRMEYFDDKAHKRTGWSWPLLTPDSNSDLNKKIVSLEVTYRLKFDLWVPGFDLWPDDYLNRVAAFHDNIHPAGMDVQNQDYAESPGSGTLQPTSRHSPPINDPVYIVRSVGGGKFGEVLLVWDILNDSCHVIKVPKSSRSSLTEKNAREQRENWKREHDIMSLVRHKNIVTYLGEAEYLKPVHGKKPDKVCAGLKFEYVAGGSLAGYSLSTSQWVSVLLQLLSALQYLHGLKPSIVHRDIKPDNILVSYTTADDIAVKFADFGLAKAADELSTKCGTLTYAAPEVGFSDSSDRSASPGTKKRKYNSTVDIFSLGSVVARGECPGFYDARNAQGWALGEAENPKRSVPSRSLLRFVGANMLCVDPGLRKTASDCLNLWQQQASNVVSGLLD